MPHIFIGAIHLLHFQNSAPEMQITLRKRDFNSRCAEMLFD